MSFASPPQNGHSFNLISLIISPQQFPKFRKWSQNQPCNSGHNIPDLKQHIQRDFPDKLQGKLSHTRNAIPVVVPDMTQLQQEKYLVCRIVAKQITLNLILLAAYGTPHSDVA